MSDEKTATLYRMVLPKETCPFGVRAKQMLEKNGFAIEAAWWLLWRVDHLGGRRAVQGRTG